MADRLLTSEMKTAANNLTTDDKQFVILICSICIGHYKTPRYLPTCGHTFCENCLLKYLRNIEERPGSKFGCPVCKKQIDHPRHDEVTLEWVQTFPLNTVIIKRMEPHSSEETNIDRRICDPCKEEGETNTGLKVCLDCKEVLCESCITYHKKVTVLKKHKLVDVAKIPADICLAEFFTGVGKCAEHPERDVQLYCQTHDAVVCAMCLVSDHKSCDMVDIACHNIDITTLQADSEMLDSHMKAAIDHCNTLQTLREENKNKFKQTLKEIRENIQHVRDQVVELMDNIVSHVTDVTKQIELDRTDGLDTDMARVSQIKELMERNVTQLDTIKQHGSEKHQFISAHLMKKVFKDTSKQISAADRHVKQLDAKLGLADNLKPFIKTAAIEKFVQIKVTENESIHVPFDSVLSPPRATPLQKDTSLRGETDHDDGDAAASAADAVSDGMRDRELVKVKEHAVSTESEYDPWYSGVTTCRDGRVILSDDRHRKDSGRNDLCLYNPSNRTIQTLKLNSRPWSAVQIDDTHLAVSCPLNDTITIVNVSDQLINELRVKETLKTHYTPWSIVALNNGHLAVAWDNPPAFGVIDVSGTQVVEKSYIDRDTNGRKFKLFQFLAVDESRQRVIQSCRMDKAVYCFDFKGNRVFKYSHKKLTDPRGVALDKCGYIYVCNCSYPRSIHRLSPTGDPISVITEGVPPQPLAICADVTGTGFWVTRDSPPHNKIMNFRLQ